MNVNSLTNIMLLVYDRSEFNFQSNALPTVSEKTFPLVLLCVTFYRLEENCFRSYFKKYFILVLVTMKSQCSYPFDSRYLMLQTFTIMD